MGHCNNAKNRLSYWQLKTTQIIHYNSSIQTSPLCVSGAMRVIDNMVEFTNCVYNSPEDGMDVLSHIAHFGMKANIQ